MAEFYFPSQTLAGQKIGGKASALAALSQSGFLIPAWFAIPADWLVADGAQSALVQAENPEDLSQMLKNYGSFETLQVALDQALAQLGEAGSLWAVRSSALDEDGDAHSFAGQLESFLFVPAEQVWERALDVWRSGFRERVLAYRKERGLSGMAGLPAVIVQKMVRPRVSGVAFGADPISGRQHLAVVSAVYGLGTALVSGDFDADTYRVTLRNEIVERHIAIKQFAHQPAALSREGVIPVPVEESLSNQPALSEAQVRAVADLVRAAGRHFGRPQDIEWAWEENALYLLQSRPITSLAQLADPDGVIMIWDNSNIVESYDGVTTPLTFSFARRAYEEVYRQFCRMLLVPARRIAANDVTFRHMLGLIRGRIYYNLMNWYRMLALLPGYQLNRKFMEQMMGVKEGLPESLAEELGAVDANERLKDIFYVGRSLLALIYQHLRLPKKISAFQERLNLALSASPEELQEMRTDELVSCYRQMEQRLLRHWDAPLINDFFAMIFFGLLRQLAAKWCPKSGLMLHNDLVSGEGGMISAEPVGRIRELAGLARLRPGFAQLLSQGTLAEIGAALAEAPDFKVRYEAYLARFGERCLDELKLESATLIDDPVPLLRAIGQLAGQPVAPVIAGSLAEEKRQAAIRKVSAAVAGHPLRRALFTWILRHARARVRDRENLRFERTRLFGKIRRLFVELGHRLAATDRLEQPRDIFYLEVEEILGYVTGASTTTDLKGLVALRRAEYARYQALPAPADRFETRGPVHLGNVFQPAHPPRGCAGESLQGLGCCPGIVRGPARLVRDPRQVTLKPGDILVAERTDPGWVMIFPAATGLLVERGSLLSHSAIVARELGLPAVVSLSGLTRWIQEGEWVEMDGSTGLVRRCPSDSISEGEKACLAL